MARDIICLFRQAQAAFLFKDAQGRNGIGHDGRLGIFGERQLIFRAFGHQAEQRLAQRLIDFLKHLPRNGTGIGQRLAHADGLAALTRKNKCAHRSPLHAVAIHGAVRRRRGACRDLRCVPLIGCFSTHALEPTPFAS